MWLGLRNDIVILWCGRYHGDGNVPGMMDVVVPLHEELERGANTENEETFQARDHTFSGLFFPFHLRRVIPYEDLKVSVFFFFFQLGSRT